MDVILCFSSRWINYSSLPSAAAAYWRVQREMSDGASGSSPHNAQCISICCFVLILWWAARKCRKWLKNCFFKAKSNKPGTYVEKDEMWKCRRAFSCNFWISLPRLFSLDWFHRPVAYPLPNPIRRYFTCCTANNLFNFCISTVMQTFN